MHSLKSGSGSDMNLTKTSKDNKINIETTLKIYPKLINLYLKATSVKFAVNFWTNEHIFRTLLLAVLTWEFRSWAQATTVATI